MESQGFDFEGAGFLLVGGGVGVASGGVGVVGCQWPCSGDHTLPGGTGPSGWGTGLLLVLGCKVVDTVDEEICPGVTVDGGL